MCFVKRKIFRVMQYLNEYFWVLVSPAFKATLIPGFVSRAVVTVKVGGKAVAEFRSLMMSEVGQVFG